MFTDILGRKCQIVKWGDALVLKFWIENIQYSRTFYDLKSIYAYVADCGRNWDRLK